MNYWLMKSEPETFSIEDLKNCPSKTSCWEGVRNYQARNFMRDDMKKGDKVLFYHSACKVPAVVGEAKVVKESYPDHFAWDKKSNYFDPKSSPENPRWIMVDIKLVKKFKREVSLKELREHAESELSSMLLLKKGQRLSIQPLTENEFEFVKELASS